MLVRIVGESRVVCGSLATMATRSGCGASSRATEKVRRRTFSGHACAIEKAGRPTIPNHDRRGLRIARPPKESGQSFRTGPNRKRLKKGVLCHPDLAAPRRQAVTRGRAPGRRTAESACPAGGGGLDGEKAALEAPTRPSCPPSPLRRRHGGGVDPHDAAPVSASLPATRVCQS
jgi:hypothetical protein